MRYGVIGGLIFLLMVAAAQALTLDGSVTQGSLLVGRTAPNSQVFYNETPVPVSREGIFFIGLDRDAPPQAVVRVVHADGTREDRALDIVPRPWEIQSIDGLPADKVTPSPEQVKRIQVENRVLASARGTASSFPFVTLPEKEFVWPAQGTLTGYFGTQRVLNGIPKSPHKGIDIAAPVGTPVVAAADGMVTLTHPDMFYTGKTVVIDHGLGLNTIYIHMDSIMVTDGQAVKKGDPIGTIGKTGRATGAHLHWGVSWFNVAVDPETFMPPFHTSSTAGKSQRR